MAVNQIVGGQGLTSNPLLLERQMNEQKREADLARSLQEAQFRQRYALEQQQMAMQQANQQRAYEQQQYENQFKEKMYNDSLTQSKLANLLKEAETRKAEERYNKEFALKEQELALKGIPEQITPYQRETLDLAREKQQQEAEKIAMGTASANRLKNKDTADLATALNKSDYTESTIQSALNSVNKLPKGIVGKISIETLRRTDPNNPIIGEWQNIKSILGNNQLLYTAMTKGAISDREMEAFQKMAANDDFNSLPGVSASLNRLREFVANETKSKADAYRLNYGDEEYSRVFDLVSGNKQETKQENAGIQDLFSKYGLE